MSIDINVKIIDLLSLEGVELVATLPTEKDSVLGQLSLKHFDEDYFKYLITPQLCIKIPGYPNTKAVSVFEDTFSFSCGSNGRFRKYLITYCGTNNIHIDILGD